MVPTYAPYTLPSERLVTKLGNVFKLITIAILSITATTQVIPFPSQVDDNQPIPQLREPAAADDVQPVQVLEGNKASSPQNYVVLPTLILVPDEDLDSYFNAPFTQPLSGNFSLCSSISKSSKKNYKHPFPTDPPISASLERSLLRVFEVTDVPSASLC